MSFLLRFIYFVFLVLSFLNTFVSPTQDQCHPDQRDSLLEFKNEFGIQKPDFGDLEVSFYPKTESWANKSDCCSWDGITCDAKSGNVIGLDLSSSCLHGRLKSNSSLFRLRHLRDLSLAYNNFTASPIPANLDKLVGLENLNLSYSSLSGQIPTKLLQLTKLVSLDLSTSSFLSVDESFLRLLARNLANLRKLDMSYVNISSELPHEFSNMWSLRSLRLANCNLFGEFPNSVRLIPNLKAISLDHNPNLRGNLPAFGENNSLRILSFFETSFTGTIPDSINNLKHLTYLSLSNSNFLGKIPFSLGNLSHLSYLDLSFNNFVGEIPSSLGNLKQLTVFDVWSNKLSGNLPSGLLNLTQLRSMTLCYNQLSGFLPPNISQHSKLEGFFARKNSFSGPFPSSLFKLPSLTDIYLDYNQLSDLVGIENVSLLPSLQTFYIGNNNYRVSPIDLNVFSPLKQLIGFSLSGIPLSSTNITSDSDFPSHLESLDLSGCNITEFPEFIRNQRNLHSLDISNNKIKGQVPDWLWKLQELSYLNLSRNSLSSFKGSLKVSTGCQVSVVDLSSNAFQGPIFIPSRFIRYLFGSKNNFSGEISRSICGLSSLLVLDLSNNNLHGSVPRCLGDHIRYLSYLNFHNNHLSGSLPDIFMNAKELRSLDVSHNRFVGKLPISLNGCLNLEVLNVGSNKINDTFPFWLSSLQKLQVLVLSSNLFHGALHQPKVNFGFPHLRIIDASHNDFTGMIRSDYFMNWSAMYSNEDNTQLKYLGDNSYYYDSIVLMSKGIEMEMERILTIYTAIDLSGNKIHGKIPESLGLLKELHVLNLSRNAFTGHIPSSFANLTSLESLDLSENKISGEIPPKLGDLYSLGWINVSHNQLVGSIPQGTQFQRQHCSSYEGNPGLYGPSLKDVCGDIHAPTSRQPRLPDSGKEEEEEWLSWVAAGLGLAPGVVFGLKIGYIIASYKHEWIMNNFGQNKRRGNRAR